MGRFLYVRNIKIFYVKFVNKVARKLLSEYMCNNRLKTMIRGVIIDFMLFWKMFQQEGKIF